MSADKEPLIRCWCGAKGTYEELFDDSSLARGCGGTGELLCECGGDLCVCHHHGAAECYGCEDCEQEVWADDPDVDDQWVDDDEE